MLCTVLRSSLRDYTYLYLRSGEEFDELPDTLRALFGRPETVMELELHEGRKLAQENVRVVMANLAEQGYHLQLPPSEDPSGWLDLPRR